MPSSQKIIFKNLKARIAEAIKESCYNFDARLYNIANEVNNIGTFNLEPGVDVLDGLTKIIDKTIKESVGMDCDLSVVVKGIFIGAFRATSFVPPAGHQTSCILINEIFRFVFRYKGNVKESVEGLVAAIVLIANEYKFNAREAMAVAKEDILSSAHALDPKFTDDIKGVFPNLDELL